MAKSHTPPSERAQPRAAEAHLRETLAALQRDLLGPDPPLGRMLSRHKPSTPLGMEPDMARA